MKSQEMFKIGLQIFNDEEVEETQNEVVEPVVEKVEEVKTPPIDLDSITKKLEKENESKINERMNSISKAFEDKLRIAEENAKKDKDNFNKIIEGLKGNNKVEDIMKEIEKSNSEAEKAKADKKLLEELETARSEAKKARDEKLEYEKRVAEDKKQSDLLLEKQKFENLLIKEKTDKPWLAEKIDKVLADEDFDSQKSDYRTLIKFFDTEAEQEQYKAKKKAGGSAFDGVKVAEGKKNTGIMDFSANYLKNLLGK